MVRKTIKQCIEECESKRVENTKAYRDAVRKTNEDIKEYERQQAHMYIKASEFISD